MLHLTKEGSISHDEPKKKSVLDDNIVVRHDFCGKKLTPEEFQEFQKIVDERRPYCSKDFVPQTFIPDLSELYY